MAHLFLGDAGDLPRPLGGLDRHLGVGIDDVTPGCRILDEHLGGKRVGGVQVLHEKRVLNIGRRLQQKNCELMIVPARQRLNGAGGWGSPQCVHTLGGLWTDSEMMEFHKSLLYGETTR